MATPSSNCHTTSTGGLHSDRFNMHQPFKVGLQWHHKTVNITSRDHDHDLSLQTSPPYQRETIEPRQIYRVLTHLGGPSVVASKELRYRAHSGLATPVRGLETVAGMSWVRVLVPLKTLHVERIKSVEAQSPRVSVVIWTGGASSKVIHVI
ncbi:hypothetical protein TNCV_2658181 [Trichonephila clavipes]|nr:hypothetical protein TNCV_2658181 [Trichonephila clavipes]